MGMRERNQIARRSKPTNELYDPSSPPHMTVAMPPPSQAPPPAPDPDLHQCVNIIISTTHPNSSSAQASLHNALVGLSLLLGKEQQGLSAKDSLSKFPISEMPAMSELVTNPQLFQVILSMLSNSTSGQQAHQTESSFDIKQGRKRSPSEDTPVHARKKQTLTTPPPPSRQQLYPVRQTSQTQLSGTSTSTSMPDSASNYQVFAATILYTVLQHMDHWPIQLMKVYAEDVFGARAWVDDQLCLELVSNLQVSLNPNAVAQPIDTAISLLADEIESYFTSLLSRVETNGSSPKDLHDRVVISSHQTPSAKEVRARSRQTEKMDDSESSSSGEEEVLESDMMEVDPVTAQHNGGASTDILTKLFQRSMYSSQSVRSRYLGHNLDLAYEAVSDALSDRLNSKSKQNTRLLQALPNFLLISRVRCLSSRHLERWLQSPAVAGLARNLLAQIAKNLAHETQPLPDDVEVIDNILKMKLKANQFAMHVESISSVASRIPTRAVAIQIFKHCLTGETTNEGDDAMNPGSEHLHILRSVYAVLDSQLAAQSLASAVLALTSDSTRSHSKSLRLVVNALGGLFDGFAFAESIIKSKKGVLTNMSDVKNNARLIFECAMLVRFGNPNSDGLTSKVLALRKTLLEWCVTELGAVYYKRIWQEEETRCGDTYDGRGVVERGPGEADFCSHLDMTSFEENGKQRYSIYKFMSAVRCLLFLNSAASRELQMFVDRELDKEELECIDFCRSHGTDIDDSMLEIVLKSSPIRITPSTAIALVETLVLGCSDAKDIRISNHVIWAMYDLSEWKPAIRANTSKEKMDLPRLAHSGLWWRVTSIALVLCSLSSDVGIVMWKEHPTLRALIKMTTAQKYRFPTADCDDNEKEKVRTEDAKKRESEAKIVELLFAAPKLNNTDERKSSSRRPPEYRQGLRSSARQREKKVKIFAQEQERKAAQLHAEQMKLRRQLKVLQKSIMIWDPVQYQRKPPKDSIDLLLSVNQTFNLAEKFRSSIQPDYLLQTIGDGRTAIERAYDWLIPIISMHPEVIHRLQPSSTCFLLLKAYGAETPVGSELIGLSAPLLSHVKKCINMDYGQDNSLMAMELLLTDIADESADRRRCSRKVLQQAIPNTFGLCGWMRQLLSATNANMLVPLTTKFVSQALAYERGKVLGIYIIYLQKYKAFITQNGLDGAFDFNFIERLCYLISTRPHVCSESMNGNAELQTLVLSEVTKAFDDAGTSSGDCNSKSSVSLTVLAGGDSGTKTIVVSSSLIRAAVVVVSNWNTPCNTNSGNGDHTSADLFQRLLSYIIPAPSDNNSDEEVDKKSISGLASAVYNETNTRVSSVEDWVSLANAKDSLVASAAAQSAPDVFLPRLLLSCGMSQLSFSAMFSRLNKMGDSSSAPAKTYGELLCPAAISEWGFPKIGSRRVIKRKLLGRILAYRRIGCKNTGMNEVDQFKDLPFVSWLMSECSMLTEKSKRSRPKTFQGNANSVKNSATEECDTKIKFLCFDDSEVISPSWEEAHYVSSSSSTEIITEDFVRSCIDSDDHASLEESLAVIERSAIVIKQSVDKSAAKVLIDVLPALHGNDSFLCIIFKWIPRLLKMNMGDGTLHLIFIGLPEKSLLKFDSCMSVVGSCAMQWPREHILVCQNWIIQKSTSSPTPSHQSMKLFLRFLLLSSEQESIHTFDHNAAQSPRFCYVESHERARNIVDLCLACCAQDVADNQMRALISARNAIPDWLALILIVARIGKPYLDMTVDQILSTLGKVLSVYSAIILRLYTLYPTMTNLTETRLRTALLCGAKDFSRSWLEFRCPLDSQIKAMISNLSKSPHKTLLQSIIQIASQHPLLLMRHLNVIHQGLLDDGSGTDSNGHALMKRGRIQGKPPEAMADLGNGRTVRVYVVFWGYSFSEPVWSSMLDLLLSVPAEVLFKVGVDLGLSDVINVYLKLFTVHVHDLKSENNIVQLRAKFNRLLSSFEKCNPERYKDAIPHKFHSNVI